MSDRWHCPRCLTIDHDGYTHCLDCGTELACGPAPPQTAPEIYGGDDSGTGNPEEAWFTVARFGTNPEAHIAMGLLQEENIPVQLVDENFCTLIGSGNSAFGWIRLQVPFEMAERATGILSGTDAAIASESAPMLEEDNAQPAPELVILREPPDRLASGWSAVMAIMLIVIVLLIASYFVNVTDEDARIRAYLGLKYRHNGSTASSQNPAEAERRK